MSDTLDRQLEAEAAKAARASHYLTLGEAEQSSNKSSNKRSTTSSPPCRQKDRGSSDDDDARGLPIYVRFEDLKRANIVRSWPALKKLTLTRGFPAGQMIGAHTRAWRLDEVMRWLDAQATANVNARLRHRRAIEETTKEMETA